MFSQTTATVGVFGAIVLASTITIASFLSRFRKNRRNRGYPKDVVILHQFKTSETMPSFSSFCLKMETWLKMCGIPYQVTCLYAKFTFYHFKLKKFD